MQFTHLGSTGLVVSRLCLGAMTYGTPKWRPWVLDEDASRPFIQRALEFGINFFDTADMYSRGVSEEVLGRALHDFARREEVVIGTKVFSPMGESPNQRGLSRLHILRSIDDSLRRLGNEFIFEKMAKQNVELLKKYSVKKILTYCPHCYTTLKNDYPQFGLEALVIHHSEFLNNLVKTGRLKFSGSAGFGKIVFHDSCYLGRYNNLYDPPRELIRTAAGEYPAELDRVRHKSFCCGAGGGRMWMEESPEHRLNLNRVREALAKTPDTIAVSCPYCMTMFEDGLKDEKASKVQVADIAEILAARIDAR